MNDAPNHEAAGAAHHYGTPRSKVPAFARYEGTSAYKKDRRRARAYAAFKAAKAATTPKK